MHAMLCNLHHRQVEVMARQCRNRRARVCLGCRDHITQPGSHSQGADTHSVNDMRKPPANSPALLHTQARAGTESSEKDYRCSFFPLLFPIPPPLFLSLHPRRSALQAKYNVSDFPSYILIRFESCLVRL